LRIAHDSKGGQAALPFVITGERRGDIVPQPSSDEAPRADRSKLRTLLLPRRFRLAPFSGFA
jgi:hypothetical protein